MDALDVMKVCLRRWWVFLPVVALALGAGLGLVRQQETQYGAYASFALIYEPTRPLAPTDPDPRAANPLAPEGGVLLGEALVADLMTADVQKQLGAPGASGVEPGAASTGSRFTVSLPPNSRSYYVSTWGPDPEALRASVEAVLDRLPVLAREVQTRAGAPADSLYTPFTTTPTQVAEVPAGSAAKILVGVLGIGLFAGSAVAILVDVLLGRWAVRRRRRALERAVAHRADEPVAGPTRIQVIPLDEDPQVNTGDPGDGGGTGERTDAPTGADRRVRRRVSR